jgi:GT2 family glycosyltransferase
MFVRTELLRDLGGFDPRYFLYFEDYDLSIRAASQSALVYVPSVEIEHGPGGAARKGAHHIRLFLVSAFRFFSSHGWRVF